ncbi:alkaline phosphatase [Ornithinimicrobium faecis]|uniref:alkaline phosphatase n=1 Tax=Ornithinimicrobium faecis TaxID=2934158 RepID=UPI002118C8AD|nr:alkaline phosphatase [Ornithinimicrobium sp. HY1745]
MSKRVCAVALATTLSVTIAGPGIASAEPGDAGASTAEATSSEGPKNVIYLVGDGMSFNQVDTGSLYEHGTSNYQVRVDPATGEVEKVPGEANPTFADFPVQTAVATFQHGNHYDPEAIWSEFGTALDSHTDSAAGGTALATGVRTFNGAIGVNPCGQPVTNISELAHERGMATGVVTSVPFSHATPAGFSTHNPSRQNYQSIAQTMINDQDLDVIMGAGHPEFDADGDALEEPNYEYIDQDTFEQLSNGETRFDYISEKSAFTDLAAAEQTPEAVFGLAQATPGLQYDRSGPDRDENGDAIPGAEPFSAPLNDNVPGLPDMAAGALNVLEGSSDEGLFLMIEGGGIDAANHQNSLNRQIEEQVEFHETVDLVLDWVETESSWDDTLVVVTADHESGYITGAGSDPTWEPIDGAQGELPQAEFHTGGHSNHLVPLFARGPLADEIGARADQQDPVRGAYLENVDIPRAIFEAWGTPVEDPDGPGDPAEQLEGSGTADDPFELHTWEDVELVSGAPDAHYQLMADLELDGTPRTQIACAAPEGFTGTFDGNGHEISGFAGLPEIGAGVFSENAGTIRNLAVTGAEITNGPRIAGIIADVNSGTIENSWTAGTITANARVGGIAGNSSGTIRDSYSRATVEAANGEAGGVAGVGLAGSTTERVYSAGAVAATANNAGGIAGYGYGGTTVQDSVALNQAVQAKGFAHAVLGRYSSGTPTLANNHALEGMAVAKQGYNVDPAPDNPKGAPVSVEQAGTEEFFAETLGWDFAETWQWDEDLGRPTLQAAAADSGVDPIDGLEGSGTAEDPYLLHSWEHVELISKAPNAHFQLMADLALDDTPRAQVAADAVGNFTGTFDGNGHEISGFVAEAGSGLFGANGGTIRNLAVTGANIVDGPRRSGIIADVNHGTIENSWTAGFISGAARVGGIVGDNRGTLRDSYSRATVVSNGTESGGVVGVGIAGSTTERVYAKGAVASMTNNSGGLAGYGYGGTIIRDSVALNPSVSSGNVFAHAILGRYSSGRPTLANNHAIEGMEAGPEGYEDEPAADNPKGAPVSVEQAGTQEFFAETLGWDFEATWQWDEGLARPTLRAAAADEGQGDDEDDELDGGDLTHYTGQFHAHTGLSSDHPTTRGEPMDAWQHVAESSDLDFFAVTEHDVTYDVRNADIETQDWRDAVSAEWRKFNEQAEEFNKHVDSTGLIAIPGTEHTWYDYAGHSNSFNTDWLATAQSSGDHAAAGVWGIGNMMFDLPMYYARLAEDPGALGQFNHPAPGNGGNFFDFTHLTPEADARMNTIEVRADDRFREEFTKALDAGWHIAPVFGADEHDDRWGENAEVTGIWASEQTEEALYESFRNRTVYTTKDTNAQLLVQGNGEMMGGILDGDTTTLDLRIEAMDPDITDSFNTIVIRSNGGEEVFTDDGLGRRVDLTIPLEVQDGDYYWVEIVQADGDLIVSAPVWIGDRVRDANYAPEIDLRGRVREVANEGQTVPLPVVRATDDSGETPTIETTVYNGAGEVELRGKAFTVTGYDDHYVVVRATDSEGSTSAEYFRIQVSQKKIDPDVVFRHFAPTTNVGEATGQVGVGVSTDVAITEAHLQFVPEGARNWKDAQTVSATDGEVYEVVREGREGENYIERIGGQPLRGHDLDLTGLEPGETYQFRLGVSASGPWTDVQGTFTAPSGENAPLYVLGDLEADPAAPGEASLFTDMLGVLREQDDRGEVLVQTGDLVHPGGRAEQWDLISEQVLGGLDLPLATMVGDGETGIFDDPDGDKEFNEVSAERNAIFQGMYNHPKNGSEVGESNYSFDQGDVHVAVLNGRHDLKRQLEWLVQDMQSSDATWRVVTGHFSYYGGAHSTDYGMVGDRAMITDSFEQLGVDLYIGGHDHLYKRTSILDGQVAQTPEEVAQGTTFVTVGSAGAKFDENEEFWWDDVVYDEDVQTGLLVDVTEDGLQLRAHNIHGDLVDELTIGKSQSDDVRLSSADVIDGQLAVGLTGFVNSPEQVVVTAETRDSAGETVIESRTQQVTVARDGGERAVTFDQPLQVAQEQDVVVEIRDLDGNILVGPETVHEGLTGSGTQEDPFEIHSWEQMELIAEAPDAHYLLAQDLDLNGVPRPQIGAEWVLQEGANGTTRGPGAFTGTFDGGGHTISGFRADATAGGGRYALGAGLFDENAGTIRDLGVADVHVEGGPRIGGLLADENTGTIERTWTSGSMSGAARLGGLVGDNRGVIRDSYSLASVDSGSTEAGGIVGVGVSGSTTERVYAGGAVSSGTNNAGGLLGYAYGGTTVRDSVALNPSVQAQQSAHGILGRYSSGTPSLAGNYALEGMDVAKESYDVEPAPDNPKGGPVTEAQSKTQEFYADTLGWDFEDTWEWNDELERPTLRAVPEK